MDTVIETITEQIDKLENETGRRRAEVINIRKHFWDDVKVNTDTFDDYLETVINLRQQAQSLAVTQITHKHTFNRLAALRRMHKAPYFGRIDFKEEGESAADQIYIGVATLTDASGENFLIYDWRAPISSVYYDYPPGYTEYSTPGGVIHGNVEKNYNTLFKMARLILCSIRALQLVMKSCNKRLEKARTNICKASLLRFSASKMKLSVTMKADSLSCKEPLVVVKHQALQRIAYLLYKYREWLKADQLFSSLLTLCSIATFLTYYLNSAKKICDKLHSKNI